MKTVCIFLFCLFISACSAQQAAELKTQSLWSFSRAESVRRNSNAEAASYPVYYSGDIYLEGDSLWILDYPCEKIEGKKYVPELFQNINDSTFDYGGERYSRQKTYDTLAITRLKQHRFNSDCYEGKWTLNRSESGGDGTGVVFIYPFEVADLLIIENEVLNNGIFRIPVNGVEREFNVSIEHPGFPDILTLAPTGSWKKKDRIMWMRDWGLPPPDKEELKKIKRGNGVDLKLVYSKM